MTGILESAAYDYRYIKENAFYTEDADELVSGIRNDIANASAELDYHQSIWLNEDYVNRCFINGIGSVAKSVLESMNSGTFVMESVNSTFYEDAEENPSLIQRIIDAVKKFFNRIASIFKKDTEPKIKEIIKKVEEAIKENPKLASKKITIDGKKMTVRDALAELKKGSSSTSNELKNALNTFISNAKDGNAQAEGNKAMSLGKKIVNNKAKIAKTLAVACGIGAAAYAGVKIVSGRKGVDDITASANGNTVTDVKAADTGSTVTDANPSAEPPDNLGYDVAVASKYRDLNNNANKTGVSSRANGKQNRNTSTKKQPLPSTSTLEIRHNNTLGAKIGNKKNRVNAKQRRLETDAEILKNRQDVAEKNKTKKEEREAYPNRKSWKNDQINKRNIEEGRMKPKGKIPVEVKDIDSTISEALDTIANENKKITALFNARHNSESDWNKWYNETKKTSERILGIISLAKDRIAELPRNSAEATQYNKVVTHGNKLLDTNLRNIDLIRTDSHIPWYNKSSNKEIKDWLYDFNKLRNPKRKR